MTQSRHRRLPEDVLPGLDVPTFRGLKTLRHPARLRSAELRPMHRNRVRRRGRMQAGDAKTAKPSEKPPPSAHRIRIPVLRRRRRLTTAERVRPRACRLLQVNSPALARLFRRPATEVEFGPGPLDAARAMR